MDDPRYQLLKDGVTCVANLNLSSDKPLIEWAKQRQVATYIGRENKRLGLAASIWGNPFDKGSRNRMCDSYQDYLLSNDELLAHVPELKGRLLCCYCAPERCHGDILATLANGQKLDPHQSEMFCADTETKKTPKRPVFNRTNDNIKWAKWTWNPVTGCKQGCYYCYAKELAVRFNNGDFEPKFIPARLPAPFNTKIPSNQLDIPGIHNVFVCSMSDLFGEWVEQGWIDKVLDACRKTPQWTYIFLTKNPKRLPNIEFPDNSWVGTTVDIKDRVTAAFEYMPQVKAPVKFISCEPLLEDLEIQEIPTGIDWVIIGAKSRTAQFPEVQPEKQWVERLHLASTNSNCKVYWKTNLKIKSDLRTEDYPETN